MAKKKDITTDSELETAEVETTTITEVEEIPEPSNQSEMMETLISEKNAEIERLTEGYKALQRTLSDKDIKLKEKQDRPPTNPADSLFVERGNKVWAFALDNNLEDGELNAVAKQLQRRSLKGAVNFVNQVRDSRTRKSFERSAETLAHKMLDDAGLLRTEDGLPSGRTRSFNEIEQQYANGEISLADYDKARNPDD